MVFLVRKACGISFARGVGCEIQDCNPAFAHSSGTLEPHPKTKVQAKAKRYLYFSGRLPRGRWMSIYRSVPLNYVH